MEKKSENQRDINILIAIDEGQDFFGTLSQWEKKYGPFTQLNDEQLIDYLYDRSYAEGSHIEILDVKDLEYLEEIVLTFTTSALENFYFKNKSKYPDNVLFNEALEVIYDELSMRRG